MTEQTDAERSASPHPRTRLDDHFSSPIRFSLVAALGDGVELDFAALRQILQCGDSPLSKAISHLEAAGYVISRKDRLGGRSRTWVRSSREGLDAFEGHLQALREIVSSSGSRSL